MIIFDPHTLKDWKERHIKDVSLFLIQSGCAGEKISIEEGKNTECNMTLSTHDDIHYHIKTSEKDFFTNIRITRVKNTWILTSDQVNARCGCGSSFLRKTGNPLLDRALRAKELIRQKKKKAHTS